MTGTEVVAGSGAEVVGGSLQVTECLIAAIRRSQKEGVPLPGGVGVVEHTVPSNMPGIDSLKLRRCGACVARLTTLEQANAAPGYASPGDEQEALVQCAAPEQLDGLPVTDPAR